MKNKRKIAIVFGTRPEIIKLAPIIHELTRRGIPFITIHTGQHYSYNMDKIFLDDLRLLKPTYQLNIGSHSHGKQTGIMLEQIEKILISENPDIVIVQGDTNSVLAGALAASKLHIPVAHVEAGLRSHDRKMPEEINRVLVGHISSFHFVPTKESKKNLLLEGISVKNIYVTGNTIVDSVHTYLEIAKEKTMILKSLSLVSKSYILVTAHRAENTDNKKKLENILNALKKISSFHNIEIIWPIHPRTMAKVEMLGLLKKLKKIKRLRIIEPVGYLDSLILQSQALVVITDSGGLQEESCILGVPCITLRENTERPETVDIGANILCGTDPKKIVTAVNKILSKKNIWSNPFGKGDTAKQIIDIICHRN